MNYLELFKTKSEEIVSQTIDLLPNAMRGDRVNRTFFIKEDEDGEIVVDYFVYCGLTSLGDNCFLTIKDHESFDPSDYEVEDFEDIDFSAIGWDKKISDAIERKIEEIEEADAYNAAMRTCND